MSDVIYLGNAVELDDQHEVTSRRPLKVARTAWGHQHTRGVTGTGKSSLSFTNLVDEFAKPYSLSGDPLYDAVVVICFGGDQNMFWNAFETARRTGRMFRFLTLDPDLQSYYFPPFQAVSRTGRNVIRIAQMLIRAFHLEHGLVYGGNYFSQQNLAALLRVARRLSKEKPHATLEDVARYLEDPINRKLFRDADQVRMTFDFLLEYPQLATDPDPENNIDLNRALDPICHPELLYFFCPTLEEPITAPLVGGLALYSLIAVATYRRKHGLPLRRTRIFIDEHQEILGRSLAAVLAQSRKYLISLFLANQSTSQLNNRDLTLADAVFEGCAVRQYFSVCGEDDVRALQSLSKDKVKTLGGGTRRGLQSSQSFRDIVVPSIERDQMLEVSATFGRSYLVLSNSSGYQAPIILEQTHRFPDYSEKPMPARPAPAVEPPSSSGGRAAAAPVSPFWHRKLADLWSEKLRGLRRGIVG